MNPFRYLIPALAFCATAGSFASAGDFDKSFGAPSGYTNYALQDFFVENEPRAIAVDAVGRVLVAGRCQEFFYRVCVSRQLPTGQLDATFGTGGFAYARVSILGFSIVGSTTLVAYDDGQVLVGGDCSSFGGCLVRFTSTGQLDVGFGTGAGYVATSSTTVRKVRLIDGKPVALVLCGAEIGMTVGCLKRFGNDGSSDTSFLNFANTNYAIGPGDDFAPDSAGKFLIVGSCTIAVGATKRLCATRFSSDGSLDLTFGSNGTALGPSALSVSSVGSAAVSLDRSDRILVTATCDNARPDGAIQQVFCTVRLNPNGSVDQTFGVDGAALIAPSTLERNQAVATVATRDNGVLIGGACEDPVIGSPSLNDTVRFCLAALTNGGMADARFGALGRVSLPFVATQLSARMVGMQLLPNSKLLISGIGYPGFGTLDVSRRSLVARLHTRQDFFDLDNDNESNAETDGILYLRHLLGFRDSVLTAGALGTYADRTLGTDIATYLSTSNAAYPNCSASIVGAPGGRNAMLDGIVLLRAMFGLTGTAVTNGINFPVGTTRTTWSDIKAHLTTNCGMALN